MKKYCMLLFLVLPAVCYIPREAIKALQEEFRKASLDGTPEMEHRRSVAHILSILSGFEDYDKGKLTISAVQYLASQCTNFTEDEMVKILDKMIISGYHSEPCGPSACVVNFNDLALLSLLLGSNTTLRDKMHKMEWYRCDACSQIINWITQQRQQIEERTKQYGKR
jgi:hypothetical protein